MAECKEYKIEEIDRNLKAVTTTGEHRAVFYDVRKPPFDIYGLYHPETEPIFRRLPADVAEATSPGVASLAANTAGGRVRFSTDSDFIAIRAVMPDAHRMYHMAFSGSSGFDLYADTAAGSYFRGILSPAVDFQGGTFEALAELPGNGMNSYTIHFPTYDRVSALYIGVSERATLKPGARYAYEKPVVYYGSSITQGACSSRPGLSYESILSRRLNVDHINLGFSGSGRGEPAMVEYLASLDPLIFVSDYDYNAPDTAHLAQTHRALYRAVREKHPLVPYVMITRPNFAGRNDGSPEAAARRSVVFENYREGLEAGDDNLWFIDGESMFCGTYEGDCTVDGTHPTDLGFALMADRIGDTLRRILWKLATAKE